MCKIYDNIHFLAKKGNNNHLNIVTPNLKIEANLYVEESKLDSLITLKEAKVWIITNGCNCEQFHYHEWLNINPKHIVAFSFIK